MKKSRLSDRCDQTQVACDSGYLRAAVVMKKNKAGYTANKHSLAGGQGQYPKGQAQSNSEQGLNFGWAGAVLPKNHKYGQFRGIRNFA